MLVRILLDYLAPDLWTESGEASLPLGLGLGLSLDLPQTSERQRKSQAVRCIRVKLCLLHLAGALPNQDLQPSHQFLPKEL